MTAHDRRPLGFGRVPLAAAALAVPLVAGGCAFDAAVVVEAAGTSPVTITESLKPQQSPHRVQGATTHNGQVVGIACAVTTVYDVREATGAAVLAQTYVLHLRTPWLRRRTPYAFDCNGPLVVELPAAASDLRATSTDVTGAQTSLSVQAGVSSIALAFGKRLRPDPKTQLAVVDRPPTLATGEYRVQLAFELPDRRAIREKALTTVAVSCGRASYLQPMLPTITRMSRVPALTVDATASGGTVVLPRIAGAVGSAAEARRTVSCPR